MMQSLLLVGLGGAAGSMLRYLFQKWCNNIQFPYGTLGVNMAGCFLIGIFWSMVLKDQLTEEWRLLLMTGFCGGFTTFSAFTLEGLQLLQQQRWVSFLVYTVLSITAGLLATFAGYKIITH